MGLRRHRLVLEAARAAEAQQRGRLVLPVLMPMLDHGVLVAEHEEVLQRNVLAGIGDHEHEFGTPLRCAACGE